MSLSSYRIAVFLTFLFVLTLHSEAESAAGYWVVGHAAVACGGPYPVPADQEFCNENGDGLHLLISKPWYEDPSDDVYTHVAFKEAAEQQYGVIRYTADRSNSATIQEAEENRNKVIRQFKRNHGDRLSIHVVRVLDR